MNTEKKIRRSDRDDHILYKKNCDYCQTEFWARKINGTCCGNACRVLKRLQKSKLILKESVK
jgi:hypothetical protein